MGRALAADVAGTTARLAATRAQLAALSPLATLARGYAVVRRERDGLVLTSADAATVGDTLDVRLAEGSLRAEVVW